MLVGWHLATPLRDPGRGDPAGHGAGPGRATKRRDRTSALSLGEHDARLPPPEPFMAGNGTASLRGFEAMQKAHFTPRYSHQWSRPAARQLEWRQPAEDFARSGDG